MLLEESASKSKKKKKKNCLTIGPYDGVVRVEIDLEGAQARNQLPHDITRDSVVLYSLRNVKPICLGVIPNMSKMKF